MKKSLNEEVKRLQKLADLLNENERLESPSLTPEEEQYLEFEVEDFLNKSLFNSDIVANDSDEFSPTREQRAIEFIIKTLQDRINYY